jgi:manganese-dependent ADP-ribose/CDP-alcohol diphosphatase
LGDFIDRDFHSYDRLLPVFNRLKAPRHHVLGNHDFSVAADQLNEVAAKLGMPAGYYAFHNHGWRFIILDGNDVSLYARAPGSREYQEAQAILESLKQRKATNAQTWNGAIGKAQLVWLDRELGDADKAGERTIVFCHFPVYPDNVHNLWNSEEVVRTLESHPSVVAYMNGHNHAGNYGQKGGIHYVTLPGMVETERTTAYAVVQVRSAQLWVEGFGRTGDRKLAFSRQ